MEELRIAAEKVILKYGAAFKKDYGWAASALGTNEPTFTKIEQQLQLAHWRPIYKLACHSVHAGSQALYFTLTNPVESDLKLIAGASNAGLADPGHNAAISLTMASVALFTFRPNIDSLIICRCMQQLCNDIGDSFLTAHDQLERDVGSERDATDEVNSDF